MSRLIRRGCGGVYRPGPGIAVPRLDLVPGPDGYPVRPPELCRLDRAPEAVLQPTVSAWLAQPAAQASRSSRLNQRDRWQLEALCAAALRDVAGLSEPAVREWIEDAIDNARRRELMAGAEAERGDTRSIRRRISRGRGLWVLLAAWPWWAVAEAGLELRAPASWYQLERVHSTFATWADGVVSPLL